jgi:hypothetical protein
MLDVMNVLTFSICVMIVLTILTDPVPHNVNVHPDI